MARRGLNSEFRWMINGQTRAIFNSKKTGVDATDFPLAKVKRAPGWDALPDADDPEIRMPIGYPVELPSPRTTRGKTQMFELQIQALTEQQLVDHRAYLRSGFSDKSSLGQLYAIPWDTYGDDIWVTAATVSDYAGDDEQVYTPTAAPSGWKRDPTVTFRQIDGKWYWWNESDEIGTPKHYHFTSGGNVENAGDAPTVPIITVNGIADGEDVHIGRDLPGGGSVGLWFRQPGVGQLIVDFRYPRKVTMNGVNAKRTWDRSMPDNWWWPHTDGIPPGTHNLWLGPGGGDSIDIDFYSASW